MPARAFAKEKIRLVILHTNDTHSRIDPFPMDGSRNQGLGGVARRAALIKQIRRSNEHVLLLDSGDIFQGTPYFNFFKGEIEFRSMTEMGYDVATLGNHDFDNGVDGLVSMMPYAGFQFVSANYDISGSRLSRYVLPYTIRSFAGIKVGLFGLGIDFDQLVISHLHEGVSYLDPIETARETVQTLRNAGCSLIICLSHLGYRYRDDRVSDTVLAQEVPEIDLVLGGHTHTFLDDPDIYRHVDGRTTIVNQVGFAGIRLGRVDVEFDRDGDVPRWFSKVYTIDQAFDNA